MSVLASPRTPRSIPSEGRALDPGVDFDLDHLLGREPAERAIRTRRRPTARFVATLVVAGLAGLLAGIDIIGLALLEMVLRGVEGDLVHVPGVAHAGWSFDGGFGYGFGPGAIVILVATSALGVALGWVVSRRRAMRRA